MHLVIVDDHESNRELCRLLLRNVAEQITTFADGDGLVEAMHNMELLPDVILLDVLMPVKNGFETAKSIRSEFAEKHIPIIFMTALDDCTSFEQCLTLGDDFILKPVERSVLVAKIQAHYRIVKILNEVKEQRDELKQFHDQVGYDYAIAESIFSNLKEEMSNQVSHLEGVRYLSNPSTLFNGDLILVANRPHGGAYILIADATGHGLPAAISTIPAARVLFSMASKGLALGEIVEELNSAMVRFLPMGMMLAASVFEVKANGLEISWWGGGLPDGYLLNEDRSINRKLTSTHMPLGVLQPDEFESEIEHLLLEPGQQLLCYTDGVIEASDPQGQQYGQNRLESAICSGGDTMEVLYESVHSFAARSVEDDLSILTIQFPLLSSSDDPALPLSRSFSQVPCKTELSFPSQVLKSVCVMTEVRKLLSGLINGAHLDFVCSVLSELFANAIEHGLLKLESDIKDQPDGFYLFYQLREQRLRELDEHYCVSLELDYDPLQHKLGMQVEHNGEGFDYHKIDLSSEDKLAHGRGVLLASELCQSLEYSNGGRCVTAVYLFD